jgi:hypothetical protein
MTSANDRQVLVDSLLCRVAEFSDLALEGLAASLSEICPRCGLHAARRSSRRTGGVRWVWFECRTPGCGWKRVRPDSVGAHRRKICCGTTTPAVPGKLSARENEASDARLPPRKAGSHEKRKRKPSRLRSV